MTEALAGCFRVLSFTTVDADRNPQAAIVAVYPPKCG
jgi:hypothetical protein